MTFGFGGRYSIHLSYDRTGKFHDSTKICLEKFNQQSNKQDQARSIKKNQQVANHSTAGV
jgi:hypothetical protein